VYQYGITRGDGLAVVKLPLDLNRNRNLHLNPLSVFSNPPARAQRGKREAPVGMADALAVKRIPWLREFLPGERAHTRALGSAPRRTLLRAEGAWEGAGGGRKLPWLEIERMRAIANLRAFLSERNRAKPDFRPPVATDPSSAVALLRRMEVTRWIPHSLPSIPVHLRRRAFVVGTRRCRVRSHPNL